MTSGAQLSSGKASKIDSLGAEQSSNSHSALTDAKNHGTRKHSNSASGKRLLPTTGLLQSADGGVETLPASSLEAATSGNVLGRSRTSPAPTVARLPACLPACLPEVQN